MTESNKESLIKFAKVLGLFLLAMVAIITSSGVWNGVTKDAISSFYGWVAGINLAASGFYIYLLYKKLFPNKNEDSKEVK